jgi:hypothetical protein
MNDVVVNNINAIGLYETGCTYTYTAKPDMTMQGQTIKCDASMPSYDAVLSSTVTVEMHCEYWNKCVLEGQ